MMAEARTCNLPVRACAFGCGLPTLLVAAAAAALLVKGCPGEVARWTGRPEGRVVVRPGMTKDEVRRQATVTISEYGDSNRYVEFELTSDGLLLTSIQMFMIDAGEDGRVNFVNMFSANESWPDLRKAAIDTEERLLAKGWKAAPGQPPIRSLTSSPREAADGVTESGAIANAQFIYSKGYEVFNLDAGGLWSGIPWWQPSSRAKSFWRNMNYFPLGDPFATASADPRLPPKPGP